MVEGLRSLGWKVESPKATFYVWAPILSGRSSLEFAKSLLKETGILVVPGIGFGEYGEGYVRFSLTLDRGLIEKALPRLRSIGL